MRIKITADSTCDLTPELAAKHDIRVIPIIIVKGDEQHRDAVDITPDDIFEYFEQGKGICSTSALNVADYMAEFEKYAADYDAVIHFGMSSGISSTYQNAMLAAAEFDNVYVVDTLNLTTSIGYMALEAAILAEQGDLSAEQIIERVRPLVDKLETSFVIDTLTYLHKGGRCSSVAALASGLLKIKPCIELTDGTMKVGKKYRGNFAHCLKLYIHDRLKNRDDVDTKRLFITHSKCDPQLVEDVKSICQEYFDFEEILETEVGCTVASHCGPNTLGIIIARK